MKIADKCLKFTKKGVRTVKRWARYFDKNVVVSLGENCMADDLLNRNGLKSFSSPYSSGRSNIEYVLGFERERFADFLNPAYMKKEHDDSGLAVVRNKKFMDLRNRYHDTVIHGFEFTHHDVMENENARKAIRRRCERMMNLKKKNIVFLYHHRLCEETDQALLIEHLNELAGIYRERGNEVSVFCFTQKLVSDTAERDVKHELDHGIHCYVFYTLREWTGSDKEVFLGKCDYDLISVMIKDIKQSL